MRMIDGDALCDWLKDYGKKVIKGERPLSLMYVWKHIRDMENIEPGIIHCKDCRHHRRDNTGCYYCVRKEYGYGWGLNDFCSDAERRTDEAD